MGDTDLRTVRIPADSLERLRQISDDTGIPQSRIISEVVDDLTTDDVLRKIADDPTNLDGVT